MTTAGALQASNISSTRFKTIFSDSICSSLVPKYSSIVCICYRPGAARGVSHAYALMPSAWAGLTTKIEALLYSYDDGSRVQNYLLSLRRAAARADAKGAPYLRPGGYADRPYRQPFDDRLSTRRLRAGPHGDLQLGWLFALFADASNRMKTSHRNMCTEPSEAALDHGRQISSTERSFYRGMVTGLSSSDHYRIKPNQIPKTSLFEERHSMTTTNTTPTS